MSSTHADVDADGLGVLAEMTKDDDLLPKNNRTFFSLFICCISKFYVCRFFGRRTSSTGCGKVCHCVDNSQSKVNNFIDDDCPGFGFSCPLLCSGVLVDKQLPLFTP